jgi:hypothetical protein
MIRTSGPPICAVSNELVRRFPRRATCRQGRPAGFYSWCIPYVQVNVSVRHLRHMRPPGTASLGDSCIVPSIAKKATLGSLNSRHVAKSHSTCLSHG